MHLHLHVVSLPGVVLRLHREHGRADVLRLAEREGVREWVGGWLRGRARVREKEKRREREREIERDRGK
jgi:hypothetical protein